MSNEKSIVHYFLCVCFDIALQGKESETLLVQSEGCCPEVRSSNLPAE